MKNYFGFLSTPGRVDEVYFHFTELELIMDKSEIAQVHKLQNIQMMNRLNLDLKLSLVLLLTHGPIINQLQSISEFFLKEQLNLM